MASGLRLIVYDATQRQRQPRALGWSWQYGTHLYRALGRVDAAHGAVSFADAFAWLAKHEPAQPISEVQFWATGNGAASSLIARRWTARCFRLGTSTTRLSKPCVKGLPPTRCFGFAPVKRWGRGLGKTLPRP